MNTAPAPTPWGRLRHGGPLRIVGLGDSLTAGWMVGRGFFERTCDLLEALVPDLALTRVNAGVPGDTAAGGLSRLPALLAGRPDVVLVQFGINDCIAGGQLGAFRRDLGRIVRATQAARASCALLTSCPLQDPRAARVVAPWYQEVRLQGRALGIPVADLALAWSADAGDGGTALWQADGVHPTDAGHARMAASLVDHLILSEGGITGG